MSDPSSRFGTYGQGRSTSTTLIGRPAQSRILNACGTLAQSAAVSAKMRDPAASVRQLRPISWPRQILTPESPSLTPDENRLQAAEA